MASVTPATPSTKETTNYARLCRVLVGVGTCALRNTFDAICTPPTLHMVLATNQPTLQSLRSRRIINPTQWGKLFPAIPTSVSSAHFDITLLMVLLRNICGLAPPTTGWDALPAVTDVSHEADIARVKYFRNSVYAHAGQASVDDATFHKHWKEIQDTLVRLGGVTYKIAIDQLEVSCMDPDVECHYKDILHQWKLDEDNIKDVLKEIGKKIDDFVASTVPSTKETSEEGKSLKLEELLDTSLVCREKHHENKLLKLYCAQCKVCICDKCGETRHNHHTKVDIHQAAEQHKVDIEEIVEEMKKGIADYKEQVDRTNESSRKSREKIVTARNKVMTSLEELVRLVKEHETTTLTCFDIIEEKEKRGHAAQLEHFQISITQLQTSVEYCEAILERNQGIEILQAHQSLTERCRGLLKAEKLNIYKPLHARYEINEGVVENVKSVVPTVGRVVVSSTDPLQSVAEGTGLQEADIESESTIKITTRDYHGNQCYNEDDQINVKVQTPSGEELNHLIASGEDGEYSVTYTPDCVGEHDVVIEVNGQPLTGSPWHVHVAPHRYKSMFTFCSYGKAQGHCIMPCGIAINDKTENVVVVDHGSNRVKLFTLKGTYLKDIGTNKLTEPTSAAFTSTDGVIVVGSHKIFCFNESGNFVKKISNQHLKTPHSLNIAPDGRMMVCDHGDNTVKVLSSDGAQRLLTIRAPDGACPTFAISHGGMFVVSYARAHDVRVFNKDGEFLNSIRTRWSGDGQLNFLSPVGLAIDRFDNLVVCDLENSSLKFFTLDGMFVSTTEGQHTRLGSPHSVAVSSTGQLFVTDLEKQCVHVFQ